jgi:hypothetical protein
LTVFSAAAALGAAEATAAGAGDGDGSAAATTRTSAIESAAIAAIGTSRTIGMFTLVRTHDSRFSCHRLNS